MFLVSFPQLKNLKNVTCRKLICPETKLLRCDVGWSNRLPPSSSYLRPCKGQWCRPHRWPGFHALITPVTQWLPRVLPLRALVVVHLMCVSTMGLRELVRSYLQVFLWKWFQKRWAFESVDCGTHVGGCHQGPEEHREGEQDQIHARSSWASVLSCPRTSVLLVHRPSTCPQNPTTSVLGSPASKGQSVGLLILRNHVSPFL